MDELQLAEQIANVAREMGIETALIGAAALAVHHYVRGTQDIDLASDVHPQKLRALDEKLQSLGLKTRLILPDADDPGGGVRAWVNEDEEDDPINPVELVNFDNPYSRRRTPAHDAIKNAFTVREGSSLRCVSLEGLIALKLDAGARKDQADVVELLRFNPNADREVIRATCKTYGFDVIDELILESQH